jgi:tRNA A37 threonylcarbamoyltransferase TsaD
MTTIKDCNFSFSGIKSQVKRSIDEILAGKERCPKIIEEDENRRGLPLTHQEIADVSWSFQEVAAKHLLTRLNRAIVWCKVALQFFKLIFLRRT